MKAHFKILNFYQGCRRKVSGYFRNLSHRSSRSLVDPRSPKGQALVMAAIFLMMATTLITIGMRLISNSSKQASANSVNIAEADNAARAGLEDALDWFIRKNGIVSAFNQTYYPGQTTTFATGVSYIDQFPPTATLQYSTNPAQSDTINASIGIVNEYPLDNTVITSAQYIARYEVAVQGPGTYNPLAMHDISGSRAVSEVDGDGEVWSVTSVGYVYKRFDYGYSGTYETGICPQWNIAYNQAPNQIVVKATVTTEFRKLGMNMPTTLTTACAGAVYCDSVTQVVLSNTQVNLSGSVTAGTNYAVIEMNSP